MRISLFPFKVADFSCWRGRVRGIAHLTSRRVPNFTVTFLSIRLSSQKMIMTAKSNSRDKRGSLQHRLWLAGWLHWPSDLPGMHLWPSGTLWPTPPSSEAERAISHHDNSYATFPWNTTSNCRNDSWTAQASQDVPSPTPWQGPENVDSSQIHDPWWTPRVQHFHAPHSWQLGVGNEEPTLPPPRLAGPCLERFFEPPPPPAGEAINNPAGLRSGVRAASSAPSPGLFSSSVQFLSLYRWDSALWIPL